MTISDSTPTRHGPQRRGPLFAAGVAAVVVALVIVVIALVGGHHKGDSDHPVAEPSGNTTTGSSSPSATPTFTNPPAGVLDVTHLRTGAAPAVDYVRNGVLHRTDGSTLRPATRHPVVGFAELADGTLVYLTNHEGDFGVEVSTAGGGAFGPFHSGYELAVNKSHTVVAWLGHHGIPMVWEEGATAPRSLHAAVPGTSRRLAAVTGASVPGCRVYASSWLGQTPHAWVITSPGHVASADPRGRLISVSDATEGGRVVGYTAITDAGSRSAVIDETRQGHPMQWSTSRHTLDSFSPTGRMVLAGPAYRDGIGDGQIAIYSDTGRLLVERQTSDRYPGFLQGATWEDDTHVLFRVFQDEKWSLVRMSASGTMEYAVAPAPGRMDHDPFVVETMP